MALALTTGMVSPSTFQWIIPSFRNCFQLPGDCIKSPVFHQADSSWYMMLCFDRFGTKWIHLCRADSGPPKTITYTIKFKGSTDVVEITKTEYFAYIGTQSITGKISLNEKESNLFITCYLNCNTPDPVPGTEFVNRDVQREVSDTDSESCDTQTDVANHVIAKENPKDGDWPPLDLKGVALLSERMKDLLIKAIEPDVTICVQDKEFRAHRIILRARSPVFSVMLAHDTKENSTSTIKIEDCDPESFDEFLLHVYSGRTENLTPSNALRLYYPADKYDFPVLKEKCVSLLKTSLSVESICDVVRLAVKNQEKELLEMATEFFARNVKKILVTVAWQNFLLQNPVEANELYIKSMEILLPEN